MIDRLDLFLLKNVYQPIADLTWRYSGKTRFFLAWLCFGISFVALCLDLYTTLAKGGPFGLGAVFGSPLLILILLYLWGASACIDRHAPWSLGFDSFDRFIRTVTMFSALFFVLVDIFGYFQMGTLGIARQTFLYVLYAFACSSGLYFIEAKPPSVELTWDEASKSLRLLRVRL
jgi:hypothetical protein